MAVFQVGGRTRSDYITEVIRHCSVECYNPATSTWEFIKNMSRDLCRSGVEALSGKLYVIDGLSNGLETNSAECYDPVADSWTTISSMKVSRSYLGML